MRYSDTAASGDPSLHLGVMRVAAARARAVCHVVVLHGARGASDRIPLTAARDFSSSSADSSTPSAFASSNSSSAEDTPLTLSICSGVRSLNSMVISSLPRWRCGGIDPLRFARLAQRRHAIQCRRVACGGGESHVEQVRRRRRRFRQAGPPSGPAAGGSLHRARLAPHAGRGAQRRRPARAPPSPGQAPRMRRGALAWPQGDRRRAKPGSALHAKAGGTWQDKAAA